VQSLVTASTAADDIASAQNYSLYGLTSEEAQIAAQIRAGRGPYDMARSRQVNVLTIQLHKARIARKLCARNDLHLVHLLGMLDLPEVSDLVYLDEIQSSHAL
jgi:DNA-binding NarL/FixJ family response regulator